MLLKKKKQQQLLKINSFRFSQSVFIFMLKSWEMM